LKLHGQRLLDRSGGNDSAARKMMTGAAALIHAGGAGVFVDNSAEAHGGRDWLALAHPENRETGPLRAFTSLVRGKDGVFSIGIHVLGCRDAVIPGTANDQADRDLMLRFLRYSIEQGKALHDGFVFEDVNASSFRLKHRQSERFRPDHPMNNPFGQWQLVPLEVTP